MPLFNNDDCRKRWFITGGAGFIGSHVVDLLVSAKCHVTVYDNLSLSTDEYIAGYVRDGSVTFFQNDVLDLETLKRAMAGHDIVWHFAANTNIPAGYSKRRLDLENDVIATWNVLEAMLHNGLRDILFPSTGAVYGESVRGVFSETSGPLFPLSLYGAGKLSSEAFIAAYCSLFGLRAWMFRFGNVVGGRANHGIIIDFLKKLQRDPATLEILGTGKGEKNYFLVEECLHGMLYVWKRLAAGPFPVLVNLGTDSTTRIMDIARIVTEEMGLRDVPYHFTGTERGWPGDQPVVLLDMTSTHALGWHAQYASDEAVRIATRRLLGKESSVLSLETLERRARQPVAP